MRLTSGLAGDIAHSGALACMLSVTATGVCWRMILTATWAWLNAALESSTFKLLILPIGGCVYALGRYLGRRRIEKHGESEQIQRARELVDLQRAMRDGNVSVDDINNLRQRLLDKPANRAVATANYYIERAEYLRDQPASLMDDHGDTLTQTEMNEQAFAMYARANNELASTVIEKVATYSPEEAHLFQQAQDAWLRWRDAESQWESKVWEGGSIRPLMVATRLEALTRERIATIQMSGNAEHDPDALSAHYKQTPKDLPDHLSPGITGERVRQLLGVPHYIADEYWFYRYSDAQLQLKVEGEVVAEFALVFIEGHVYETTLEGVGPFRFGELTLDDLSQMYPPLEITHRFGARTGELCAEMPLGVANTQYFFGSISTDSGGRLLRASDAEDEPIDGPQAPGRMRVNWLGRTQRDEAPYIWWHI